MPAWAESESRRSPDSLSIACVIHSLAGGGAERVMAGLASRLSEKGHHVTLITFGDGADDRHDVAEGVLRDDLNLAPGRFGVFGKWFDIRRRYRALRGAVDRCHADVVLSFCDRNNIDVLMALRRSRTPVVACERSDPAQQSLGFFRERLRQKTYRSAASIIALTETSARFLRQIQSKVVVIPSAIDPPPLMSDRKIASSNKTIVSVGRLEHEKGFDRLIEAFSIATKEDASWKLVIHGEGSERSMLEQAAQSHGVSDRVALPGWTRPVWRPLSEATLFCLPSRYEGFPSALLEAMSMGVPSLSVDCESGPRAIIRHGENGLLVDPSVKGIVEGLRRWMEDREERERLALEGRSVVEQFSWSKMVDAYEAALRSAVDRQEA